MRKLVVILIVAALTAGPAASAVTARRTLRVGDNWFVRPSGVPTVTVERGDTVVWRFIGRRRHNITVRRGPVRFHSPTKRSGTYARQVTPAAPTRSSARSTGARPANALGGAIAAGCANRHPSPRHPVTPGR